MASDKNLHKGDHVEWDTAGGKTEGTVEKRVTSKTEVKGHTAKATKDDPQYVVKTDESEKKAVHKPDELERIKKD